jgi:sugar phosphate isomerase/epimerase
MPEEYRNPNGILAFASKTDEIGSKLAQAGIVLSYHNHNFEFAKAGDKTWLEILFDNTNPQYLQAELDTYWVQAGGGDPAEWIRKYPGRMQMMHVKDMVIAEGNEQRFAEIGEGNLNWPAILAAAKDAGVEWYCVEQDDCYGSDPFDCLKISLENLHQMGLK